MDIAAFSELFKLYAAKYKYRESAELQPKPLGFFHFDMEDLLVNLNTIKLPALFLSTPEVDFGGINADNITNSNEASFMVLLQLPNKDIRKKGVIIQKAKVICEDILRRLLFDQSRGVYDQEGRDLLEGFNINGPKCGVVNRTIDNLYGWSVSFNTEDGFDAEIRPDMWEDLAV